MGLNFSHHRMNDLLWVEQYQEKLSPKVFFKFIDTVYAWLENLKPGQKLILSQEKNITNQNRDLFIKTTCLFISEGNSEYEFSNDYTAIIRKKKIPIRWKKKEEEEEELDLGKNGK